MGLESQFCRMKIIMEISQSLECNFTVMHHPLCPLPEGTVVGPCPWPCLSHGYAGSQPRCPSGTELTQPPVQIHGGQVPD